MSSWRTRTASRPVLTSDGAGARQSVLGGQLPPRRRQLVGGGGHARDGPLDGVVPVAGRQRVVILQQKLGRGGDLARGMVRMNRQS